MSAKFHGISFVGEGMGGLYYVVLAGLELKATPVSTIVPSLSWLFLNLHKDYITVAILSTHQSQAKPGLKS